mmetsp:Transcript_6280/g.20103  ORF Transcript_6280/g.20103 Transcript_6280/m.20103 type:complete len:112 (-) Transcript_6280:796-1131(-)
MGCQGRGLTPARAAAAALQHADGPARRETLRYLGFASHPEMHAPWWSTCWTASSWGSAMGNALQTKYSREMEDVHSAVVQAHGREQSSLMSPRARRIAYAAGGGSLVKWPR